MNSTRNHHHLPRPTGQTIREGITRDNNTQNGNNRNGPSSHTYPNSGVGYTSTPSANYNPYPQANYEPNQPTHFPQEPSVNFGPDYEVIDAQPKANPFSAAISRVSMAAKRRIASWLGALLNFKDGLNQSKLIDNALVKRIDALLVPLFDWTRLSPLLTGVSQRTHSIVAQGELTSQRDGGQGTSSYGTSNSGMPNSGMPSQAPSPVDPYGNQPAPASNYWSHQADPTTVTTPVADNRPLSTVTRLSFVTLALCLLIGGGLWINDAATATSANGATGTIGGETEEASNSTLAQDSFAVINPTNIGPEGLQAVVTGANATDSDTGAEASKNTIVDGGVDGNAPLSTNSAQGISSDEVQPLAVIAAAMTTEPTAESTPVPNTAAIAGNAPNSNSPEAGKLSNIVELANASANSAIGTLQTNSAREQITGALSNAVARSDDESGDNSSSPKTIGQIAVAQVSTATPSPTITPTPTEEEIPVDVPQVKLIPMLPYPSALPTATATATPTITPTPLPIKPGALWSTFIPGPPNETDHFWVERPFLPSERFQLASTNYQFGSTAYGRYRMHHGIDMSNPIGTPVLAAATGEVIHAGVDDPVLLAPFNNFYGNAVVIRLDQKLNIAGSDIDVFLLLGHLTSVTVEVGQRVSPQDVVGTVGMTGIAIGPHLHLEVRVGSNTYDKSVNPYLWMQPRDGTGAVAVRLITADGRTWPGGRVSLIGQGGTRFSRTIEIYLDEEPIGPDPSFGENGAMGSVPPGNYLLAGIVNGEKFRKEIVVNAGETTFAEIRTNQ